MSLYEAQVIPYGKLHTILVTHVSGRYLPAGRGTERSVGRLGKWMWDIWLFSLTRGGRLGMQLREAAPGERTPIKNKRQHWRGTYAYKVVESKSSLEEKWAAKASWLRQSFPRRVVRQKANYVSGWTVGIWERVASQSDLRVGNCQTLRGCLYFHISHLVLFKDHCYGFTENICSELTFKSNYSN